MFKKYQNEVELKHKKSPIDSQSLLKNERILSKDYFQIIEQQENSITGVCRFCKRTIKDSMKSRPNFLRHLRVSQFKQFHSFDVIKGFIQFSVFIR